jgi:hypothetical protein
MTSSPGLWNQRDLRSAAVSIRWPDRIAVPQNTMQNTPLNLAIGGVWQTEAAE